MMKQDITKFASRLAMLALALCMGISFTACEDDDDKGGNDYGGLVGTWTRKYKMSKDEMGDMNYSFYSDGTGYFSNTSGTTADFTFTIKSEGVINYTIKYFYAGGGYKTDSYYWHYSIRDNGATLYLDNEKYTRKR